MKIINLENIIIEGNDDFKVEINKKRLIISTLSKGSFLLKINNFFNEIEFHIDHDCNIIEDLNISSDDEININYFVAKEVFFRHTILNIETASNLKINHNVELANDSKFEGIGVEISNSDITSHINVNLAGQNIYAYYRLAASSDDKKKVCKVSFNHLKPNTFSNMDNYGVSKNNGSLIIEGIGKVIKGAYSSKTEQTGRILLFDPNSRGEIKPILLIDEDDVDAQHAASLGQIDENHLFYLTSRGLNMQEARSLISKGYLFPVIEYLELELKKYVYDALVRKVGF